MKKKLIVCFACLVVLLAGCKQNANVETKDKEPVKIETKFEDEYLTVQIGNQALKLGETTIADLKEFINWNNSWDEVTYHSENTEGFTDGQENQLTLYHGNFNWKYEVMMIGYSPLDRTYKAEELPVYRISSTSRDFNFLGVHPGMMLTDAEKVLDGYNFQEDDYDYLFYITDYSKQWGIEVGLEYDDYESITNVIVGLLSSTDVDLEDVGSTAASVDLQQQEQRAEREKFVREEFPKDWKSIRCAGNEITLGETTLEECLGVGTEGFEDEQFVQIGESKFYFENDKVCSCTLQNENDSWGSLQIGMSNDEVNEVISEEQMLWTSNFECYGLMAKDNCCAVFPIYEDDEDGNTVLAQIHLVWGPAENFDSFLDW